MTNFKKNYFIYTLGLIALFLVYLVPLTEASSVIRSGETVSLSDNESIEGDFYTASGKINISGAIRDDLLAMAGHITTNGSIGGDVLIVAGQADIHGTVGDDLRIVAGEVTIADPVMGDVFIMGGTVDVLSTASVTGDMIVFGGKVNIEGSIGGNLIGTVDNLRIDGQIAGDVDVTVGQITLGDKAKIAGSVIYVSDKLIIQSQNATIGNDLVKNDPILVMPETNLYSFLIPVLVLFFSVLVWFWMSRRSLSLIVDRALIKSPRPILLGFLTILLAPPIIGMLMLSMIGLVVALVIFLGVILLMILSTVALTTVIGKLILQSFNKPNAVLTLTTIIVGVIAVALLMSLPIVGHAIWLLFMVLTLGAMVDLLIRPKLD